MSCSCKKTGAVKQPSAVRQIVKSPRRVNAPSPAIQKQIKRV